MQIPNVLPPTLAPYAKLIYGAVAATITALLTAQLGIDVSDEVLPGSEITWRQAVTAAVPLLFVFAVPNGATVHTHDDTDPPDHDGVTTLGTELASITGSGPRGEPQSASVPAGARAARSVP